MKPVIFWDFDGTLAFRGKLFATSLKMALNEHNMYEKVSIDSLVPLLKSGLPWHDPDIKHTHIQTADQWWDAIYPVLAIALHKCGVNESEALFIAKESRKYTIAPQDYLVFDDALEVLAKTELLGYRNIMLSNHIPELLDIAREIGLMEHIEICITSATSGYEKPHPMLYKKALDIAGNPNEAWMIGDNLIADIKGAQNCGLRTILIKNSKGVIETASSKDLTGVIDILMGK